MQNAHARNPANSLPGHFYIANGADNISGVASLHVWVCLHYWVVIWVAG